MQRMELDRIAKHYKIGLIPLPLPTDEDVARVAGARLTAILEGRFRNLTGLERMRVARYTQLARDLASEGGDDEDSALLLAMLLDSAHQESLRENRFPDPSSPSSAGQNGGSRHGSGRGGSGSRGGRSSRGGNVGNSDRSERGDRSDRGERGARSERGETASGESAEARSGRRRRSSRRRDGEQGRDAGDTAPRNEQGKTDSAE